MNSSVPVSRQSPAEYFDRRAREYDATWTDALSGRLQRECVWRHLEHLVRPGCSVVDLGCGTGEDALFMSKLGARVVAIDTSPVMVRIASEKGVDARQLRIEDIRELGGCYDVLFSNFGAMNCIRDLTVLCDSLGQAVPPGGYLVICLLNRLCLWEFIYYCLRCEFRKACRRWRGVAITSSGLSVFYPSQRTVRRAFSPRFHLHSDTGIGIAVPPSFVHSLPSRLMGWLGQLDARLSASGIGRGIGDHRLLVFVRS